jgi:hypothetical protein
VHVGAVEIGAGEAGGRGGADGLGAEGDDGEAGGSMKPFWLPVTAQSTPHSSMRKSIEAIELTPSTMRSAGWPVASRARRTAAMSEVTPVAVSLWVTRTALMLWPRSSASAASKASAGAPSPQGRSITSTSRLWRRQSSIQRWENMPCRAARTRSPGESVLVIAASQPAVPVAGKITISASRDFRTARTPSKIGGSIRAKDGERWSRVGTSHARLSRSGMLVGPGMKTGFWLNMGDPPIVATICSIPRAVAQFF